MTKTCTNPICGHKKESHQDGKYGCWININKSKNKFQRGHKRCKCKKFEAVRLCHICKEKEVRSETSNICEDCGEHYVERGKPQKSCGKCKLDENCLCKEFKLKPIVCNNSPQNERFTRRRGKCIPKQEGNTPGSEASGSDFDLSERITESMRKKENAGDKPIEIIMTKQSFDKLRNEYLDSNTMEIKTIFGMKIKVIEDFIIIGVNKFGIY